MEFHPVTVETLPDLERFSREHGKFRWCSCMRWRVNAGGFARLGKEGRPGALEALVRSGVPVGILGYEGGKPVAWCSIAPRETYAALERSHTIPRIDDRPAWSVVCFFVDRGFRRRGVTAELLRAAVGYAASQGARVVEGYPRPEGSASYSYMGSPATFREAGFRDVTPAGARRPVTRRSTERDR